MRFWWTTRELLKYLNDTYVFDSRQKLLLLAKSTTSLSSNASSSVKANANQAAALNPSDPNYFGSPYRDGFHCAIFFHSYNNYRAFWIIPNPYFFKVEVYFHCYEHKRWIRSHCTL